MALHTTVNDVILQAGDSRDGNGRPHPLVDRRERGPVPVDDPPQRDASLGSVDRPPSATRVSPRDAAAAFKRAVELGATPFESDVGPMELNIPAIEGIGGSLIYLVDRYGENTIYDVDFEPVAAAAWIQPASVQPQPLGAQARRGVVVEPGRTRPGRAPSRSAD